jgi:6-phosphofructokinase 1
VANELERRGNYEVRTTVLGHLQRGGSPSAYDRIWATRVGAGAYDAITRGEFGVIPVVQNSNIAFKPLTAVAGGQRPVPREIYDLCRTFF